MPTTSTLSMGQIAQLADVQRPVVSMWRKRPVPGAPFPSQLPDGRFAAEEVLDWLERTGRGKNRSARVDLALQDALSPSTPAEELDDLLALVAARCIMGRNLAPLDPEDVLDVVEDADGDDEWLWSEVEHADFGLAPLADLAAGASWAPADAHDRILTASRARDPRERPLAGETSALLADVARYCLAPGGEVVDVAGSTTDSVLHLLRDEDLPEITVVVPGEGPQPRMARQRLHVRNIPVRSVQVAEDWELPAGSVLLLRLPEDPRDAWQLLDETSVQLPPESTCLVLGAPDLLLGRHSGEASAARGRVMGSGLLRAAVHLPHQRRDHTVVEQMLWVLASPHPAAEGLQQLLDARIPRRGRQPTPASAQSPVVSMEFADLGSASRTTQALVLDLAAAAGGDDRHRMRVLRPVRVRVPSAGEPVQMARGPFQDEMRTLPHDDAARINRLLARLTEPLPDALSRCTATASRNHVPSLVTVGDALTRGMVTIRPGARGTEQVGRGGGGRLWTTGSLSLGRPEEVDLPQLHATAGRGRRTKPGDVVFSSAGKPSAVVDTAGGAVVAFPLRVLRIKPDAELAPAGVAAAVNGLPPDSGAWREWRIPLATYRSRADDLLLVIEDYERGLDSRKNDLDALRRLVARSVPSGAVQLTSTDDDDKEGR